MTSNRQGEKSYAAITQAAWRKRQAQKSLLDRCGLKDLETPEMVKERKALLEGFAVLEKRAARLNDTILGILKEQPDSPAKFKALGEVAKTKTLRLKNF